MSRSGGRGFWHILSAAGRGTGVMFDELEHAKSYVGAHVETLWSFEDPLEVPDVSTKTLLLEGQDD